MKKMQKWLVSASVSLSLSLFLFVGMASAHVTVQPPEVPANSYQVFTVRVPSETKGVNTIKVQVKAADGAAISRVEPKQGWKHEIEKNADGSIASVTWTADGPGLAETEFTEFRLSGKVNEDATQLVWRAYQTYSDNSVVEWIGGDGADKPASVQKVTPAVEGGGDGHGAGGSSHAAGDEAKDEGQSQLPLILSIVAVVLGAAALVTAAAKKKK
ncbi:YcnI family protein [Paenibacillus gorillae]|uniref:YcnI family protein n=1 Tax=Paenibacillus gorillae TaxID=1243662 RepID=UPI0004B78170